jgi:hypothetical protein
VHRAILQGRIFSFLNENGTFFTFRSFLVILPYIADYLGIDYMFFNATTLCKSINECGKRHTKSIFYLTMSLSLFIHLVCVIPYFTTGIEYCSFLLKKNSNFDEKKGRPHQGISALLTTIKCLTIILSLLLKKAILLLVTQFFLY